MYVFIYLWVNVEHSFFFKINIDKALSNVHVQAVFIFIRE